MTTDAEGKCTIGITETKFATLVAEVSYTAETTRETKLLLLELFRELEKKLSREKLERETDVKELSRTINRWAGAVAVLVPVAILVAQFVAHLYK